MTYIIIGITGILLSGFIAMTPARPPWWAWPLGLGFWGCLIYGLAATLAPGTDPWDWIIGIFVALWCWAGWRDVASVGGPPFLQAPKRWVPLDEEREERSYRSWKKIVLRIVLFVLCAILWVRSFSVDRGTGELIRTIFAWGFVGCLYGSLIGRSRQGVFPGAKKIIGNTRFPIAILAIAVVSFFFIDDYRPLVGPIWNLIHGHVLFIPYRWIVTLSIVLIAAHLMVRWAAADSRKWDSFNDRLRSPPGSN